MEPLKSSKVLILYLVCVFKRTQHKIYIYREIDGWIDIMLCSLIKKCGVPGDTEADLLERRWRMQLFPWLPSVLDGGLVGLDRPEGVISRERSHNWFNFLNFSWNRVNPSTQNTLFIGSQKMQLAAGLALHTPSAMPLLPTWHAVTHQDAKPAQSTVATNPRTPREKFHRGDMKIELLQIDFDITLKWSESRSFLTGGK